MHGIAYRDLFETALDPHASRELTGDIAESAWSGRRCRMTAGGYGELQRYAWVGSLLEDVEPILDAA